MSLLEIALIVAAVLVLLTFAWGLTQPDARTRRMRRPGEDFRRGRNDRDLL
jgi:hypothetical protein